ncbi:efflux RND transporter permease subunit [Granulosicoccaceae sp. 1_MG-2023]|nr:efflux RND transporter permease subunit [Granulosicoccaceae sp. 1_MG-2023]
MSDSTRGRGIIDWFAANPVAANLLMVLIIVLGILQAGSLRKEAFPSMEPDSIDISVSYSSGDAVQNEEGIAIKIEEQLEGLTGIESVTSTSTGSSVSVTVEKTSEYDLDTLLRDVKTRVDAISTLPADADNPVIEKATREEHALYLQLFGQADRTTLQQLAYRLKQDLLSKDNINEVSLTGWVDPMMTIEINEGRLQALGLSLSDVEDAVNAGSSSPQQATLRNDTTYLQLKASEQAYLKEDFQKIPLTVTDSGARITLGDVTTVTDTFDDETPTLSRFNGQNSIGVQVITTGTDDITDSVVAAKEVVAEWHERNLLPVGVELQSWYDRSVSIQERLALLTSNAATGIVLVFVLLALFLNLTVAFWVAMGLPFIFFGTLFVMGGHPLDLSLNEFTTFGFILALGIVVDDAVVVGESVYAQRRRYGDTLANTIEGTRIVAVPTLFGVFTTVAAFYALSNIEGGLGKLYSQFAAVVTACLILSIIESKLILPSHLAHLNTHKAPAKNPISHAWQKLQHFTDSGLQFFTRRMYTPALRAAIHHRYATAVLFCALFIFVMAMPFNGSVRVSFFPEIPGETVRATLSMQNDVSVGLTHRTLLMLEDQVYEIDAELRGDDSDDPRANTAIANLLISASSDQSGTIILTLKDDAPYELTTLTRAWRAAVGLPEGVRSLNIQSRRGSVDALRIELRAADTETLTAAGNWLKEKLGDYPAISGIEDNIEPGLPQLTLKLNELGESLGLTTSELATQILQSFSGQTVQRYQRGADEIEVKVRYPEADRMNPSDVLKADVRTSDGTVLPVASVATVTRGYAQNSIVRIDSQRAVYITAEVDKDIMSSTELVSELKSALVPQLQRQYAGVDVHFAGEAEEQAETEASMVQMFAVAMLVIYILLAIPLKSYVQPLLIMTAIPFGVVGAILGHWSNDLSLGILSLNGIIALSGVVVNDSLLLVSRFNDTAGDFDNPEERVIDAGTTRLRAVLLTSLTTFAGLMPLLQETSHQAQFLIPAAVSLGYGIMFATVITLLLIPCLLLIVHDIRSLPASLRQRFKPGHA